MRLPPAISLFVTLALLVSCQAGPESAGQTQAPSPEGPQVSAADAQEQEERLVDAKILRSELIGYANYSGVAIAGIAGEIAAASEDRELRELMLMWRVRGIPVLRVAALSADPREGLVFLWASAVRSKLVLEQDEALIEVFAGRDDLIAKARDVSDRMLEHIEQLAREYTPPGEFDAARADVVEVAGLAPVTKQFGVLPTLVAQRVSDKRQKDGGVGAILSLPLAPFTGLQGIGGTPAALEDLALAAQLLAHVAEDMPQVARWQTEMLVYEIQSTHAVKDWREDFGRLVEATERFEQDAATLPRRLREEFDDALVDGRAVNEELRLTLEEARAVSEHVREVVTVANETAMNIERASATLGTTGEKWSETGVIVEGIVSDIRSMTDREPDPDAVPMDVLIERINATAVELQALVDSLEGPLPPDSGIAMIMQDIETISDRQIDRTADEMRDLVDVLTWRALLIVGIVLVAAVVFRVIPFRVRRAPDSSS